MAVEEKEHVSTESSEKSNNNLENFASDKSPKDSYGPYEQGIPSLDLRLEFSRRETHDDKLKKWIRILKFVSRSLGVILSIATIIPLAMMTQKYLSTRNSRFIVNGTSRTPWPDNTETVYNYVYLVFSTLSLLLHVIILLAYFRGIQQANSVARIHAIWAGIFLGVQIIVMIIGVAVYRGGADVKRNGVSSDLWGWTCSQEAGDIQPWITDMNYSTWCDVQTTAYYVGIANIAAAALTGTIYVFAVIRKRSKEKLHTLSRAQTFDRQTDKYCTWAPLDET